MMLAVEDTLDCPTISDLIIAKWRSGFDTVDIAHAVQKHLFGAGVRVLPTISEAEAHAHNVLALYRDTIHALRQREVAHA